MMQDSEAGSTQKTTQSLSFDDDETDGIWGRLCPTKSVSDKYQILELTETEYTIGRDGSTCDILLDEPQISSRHCKIEFIQEIMETTQDEKQGIAWVHDYSTNGTYLNKHKIGKGKKSVMYDGDELVFIQYAKKERKTGKERHKVSFWFYKQRDGQDNDGQKGISAKYDIRETLGTGSFATVKLGVEKETGKLVAVKEIDKQKYQLKSKNRKHNSIMNESEIMRQVDHANIIKVFDVYDTDEMVYLVLEMAQGGELFHKILKNKKLDEYHSRIVMRQLLDAIVYLHEKKIAHRDLKPENILMKDKNGWDIKISDFGLSRLLDVDSDMLTTMCGTPLFLAPEVLQSKKRGGYGFEVDYWSMGIILYLMLVGHPPYNEKDGPMLELVRDGRFSFPRKTWSMISETGLDIVTRLMCVDPSKRLTGEQMKHHPWMLDMDTFPPWFVPSKSNPWVNGYPNMKNGNNRMNNGHMVEDQKQGHYQQQQQRGREGNKGINKPAMQLFGVSTTAAQRLQSQDPSQDGARMSQDKHYDENGNNGTARNGGSPHGGSPHGAGSPMTRQNRNHRNNNNYNNNNNMGRGAITGKKRTLESALTKNGDIAMTGGQFHGNTGNVARNVDELGVIDENGSNNDFGIDAPPKKRQRFNAKNHMSMDDNSGKMKGKEGDSGSSSESENDNDDDNNNDDKWSQHTSQRSDLTQLTPLDSLNFADQAPKMIVSQSDNSGSDEDDDIKGFEKKKIEKRHAKSQTNNRNMAGNRKGRKKEMSID